MQYAPTSTTAVPVGVRLRISPRPYFVLRSSYFPLPAPSVSPRLLFRLSTGTLAHWPTGPLIMASPWQGPAWH